jgi:ATP-dependent DNA ligase
LNSFFGEDFEDLSFFDRFDEMGFDITCEYKYDGLRAQF